MKVCEWIFTFFAVVHILPSSVCAFKHFSTKTAYGMIHSNTDIGTEDEYNSVSTDKLHCSAVHVSSVIRHGARFPGQEDVRTISEIHKKIQNIIQDGQFESLKKWKNPFPDNNDKVLMDLGEEEQYRLGQRTARRLKSLFMDEEMEYFRFLVSSKQRTQRSASSFYEGFTEVLTGEADDEIDSELSDETLRFHERCKRFIVSVEKNKTALNEFTKFKSADYMKNVVKKLNTKLQLPDDQNIITLDNVRTVYLICGYETALFGKSPWCDLFDEDDMKVLEYLSDLKHYYKNGHRYKITRQQSCPLMADMFTTMDDAIVALEPAEEEEVEGYILGNFQFGHAETLGPLYAALGLFNDSEPLRADNYEKHHSRRFRTSEILPFSANVMFVLYECEPNDNYLNDIPVEDTSTTVYLLKLFVNEKPEKIPGCDDYLCPFDKVREKYETLIDDCNFSQICQVTPERPKDEL